MRSRFFNICKKVAVRGSSKRQYLIGAVGLRRDGAIVKSSNIPNREPEKSAHAEARLCKKLGYGGVVFVVRVLRDGSLAMARPCPSCQRTMRNHGVQRCYYSINDNEYGVMML